jgi:Zn-finger nucleic acid-binding protein
MAKPVNQGASMYCPKCKSDMEFGTIHGIRVERCLQCLGMWFREAEHHLLKRVKGSESIDLGPVEIGRDFDSAENVPCPVCGKIMDRIADAGQRHIRYESCPEGHGVFFDAGEYKDYRKKTLGDFFKSLAAPSP